MIHLKDKNNTIINRSSIISINKTIGEKANSNNINCGTIILNGKIKLYYENESLEKLLEIINWDERLLSGEAREYHYENGESLCVEDVGSKNQFSIKGEIK